MYVVLSCETDSNVFSGPLSQQPSNCPPSLHWGGPHAGLGCDLHHGCASGSKVLQQFLDGPHKYRSVIKLLTLRTLDLKTLQVLLTWQKTFSSCWTPVESTKMLHILNLMSRQKVELFDFSSRYSQQASESWKTKQQKSSTVLVININWSDLPKDLMFGDLWCLPWCWSHNQTAPPPQLTHTTGLYLISFSAKTGRHYSTKSL